MLRQLLPLASIPREPEGPDLSAACHTHTREHPFMHTSHAYTSVLISAIPTTHIQPTCSHKDFSRGWRQSPAACLPQGGSVSPTASWGGSGQTLGPMEVAQRLTGSPGGGLEVLACLEGCLSPHRALNSLVKFISYIPKVMDWAWFECLCIKRIPSPHYRGAERIPDMNSCKDTMSPQHTH